jgi:hypothetical protein
MKQLFYILNKTMLGMFILLAVGMAQAQNTVTVTIPFNFTVGRQNLSAGEYTFRQDPFSRTMELRSQKGQVLSHILIYSAETSRASSSGKLVFHQYGGHYFLAQIWEAEQKSGQQLMMSPVEVEMSKAQQSPGRQIALNVAPQH